LFRALPRRDTVAEVLGKQLLRSATSVAAHYREACRAKSDLDFISKLEGAQQELDESELWLELLSDADVIKPRLIQPLREETNELIAILVTMTRKVKTRRKSTI
jgi:four helix bundle protein